MIASLQERATVQTPILGTISPVTGSRLLKTLTVDVHYPDGSPGVCDYHREGPTFHKFNYRIRLAGQQRDTTLAYEVCNRTLGNDVSSIESMARELARQAFGTAIENERKNYFCRATETDSSPRKKRVELYQMKGTVAKEIAGKYALVDRCTQKRVSDIYDTWKQANEAYQALVKAFQDHDDVPCETTAVMCCNRLDRCWEIPIYNPIYKDYPHLRPEKPHGH